MKRFFRKVATIGAAGGIAVHLDGRPVRTPARAHLLLPTAALADAVAGEWRAQGDEILPLTMPFTRLANTAIDRVAPRRDAVIDEIAGYGGTDLVCYRADAPAELAARQAAAWEPLMDWLAARHGARLEVVAGVTHRAQPREAPAALRGAVAAYADMELAALHSATTAAGSLVIALALAEGRIDAAAALAASQIDEAFQSERWGEDEEAAARRAELGADLAAAAEFLALCGG